MKKYVELKKYVLFNIGFKIIDSAKEKEGKQRRCFWCIWFYPYIENHIYSLDNYESLMCLCYKNKDNKSTGELNPNYKCKWYKVRAEQVWNLKYKEIKGISK